MTEDEIKKWNARWMPFCGWCYWGEDGKLSEWGHCQLCESKREAYEKEHSI